MAATDVGIDSFPMNGSTIALDMLSLGIPYITLRGPVGEISGLVSSRFHCDSEKQFLLMVDDVLASRDERFSDTVASIYGAMLSKYGNSAWANVLEIVPAKKEPNYPDRPEIDDEALRLVDLYLVASEEGSAFKRLAEWALSRQFFRRWTIPA
jgi:hypothetical protein